MKWLAVGLVAFGATAARPAAADWSPSGAVPGTVGAGFPYDADVGGGGRIAVAVVRRGIRVIVRDQAGQRRRHVNGVGRALRISSTSGVGAGRVSVTATSHLGTIIHSGLHLT